MPVQYGFYLISFSLLKRRSFGICQESGILYRLGLYQLGDFPEVILSISSRDRKMVRTKDTAGVKVVGAKASRKTPPTAPASSATSGDSSSSKNKYVGGNPYCPRVTPTWQKPITQFFAPASNNGGESSCSGSSGGSSSAGDCHMASSSTAGQSSSGES